MPWSTIDDNKKIETSQGEIKTETNNFVEETQQLKNEVEESIPANNQLNTLKNNIETSPNYGKSFVEYLKEYPQTLQKIEWYLQEPETIETWSLKIENIWGEFSFGAMDPQLQEKIKKEPVLIKQLKGIEGFQKTNNGEKQFLSGN